jgi:bifunctional enzyme Fae/Hps
MSIHIHSKLDPKKKYLQVALNGTLDDAREIISSLPISDRIIIEAGTPLIKRYGESGVRQIRAWADMHLAGAALVAKIPELISKNTVAGSTIRRILFKNDNFAPAVEAKNDSILTTTYIVADMKTMDRGMTEVEIAARGGASAVIALGTAPIETLNSFIAACDQYGLDPMIDMMNVEYPLSVLRSLKKVPPVVILHRGVDEERDNKEKRIPLHEIRRIKGSYNIMISIAGGDTVREVQSSVFNDADIVVVWKSVYQKTNETVELVNGFLKAIK